MRGSSLLAALLPSALVAQATVSLPPASPAAVDFVRDVAPIFQRHCYACHGPDKQRSGYRLDVRDSALRGGDQHAPAIVPGNSAASPLIRFVAGLEPELRMPQKGDLLDAAAIGVLRRWIDDGADWPDAANATVADPLAWWSLQPLQRPAVPTGDGAVGHPIDAFVRMRLAASGLSMAGEADARTLCRRVWVDLVGLLPTPEQLDAYVADPRPDRYERLVDELLASERHGERWARHWLDAVHYGDTHGYDKDQPRPHAWPYRDYVVRAFNQDKPYARFVAEQIAGDALYPGTRDGIEALGFLAAGPWDLIGHEEVSEDKIDGKFARHFDRDDMVGNAIGTLASITVQCAQCHDHKFDPIAQRDYYALQAVFASIDRADKAYDLDPQVAAERRALTDRQQVLAAAQRASDQQIARLGGEPLVALDARIAAAERTTAGALAAEYGWHSAIAASDDHRKWVQVDLGASQAIDHIVLAGAFDEFAGIGAGFGFPRRFRIDASDDPEFGVGVHAVAVHDGADYSNPGTVPQTFAAGGLVARFVRVTATKLAPRQNDFIAALAELLVVDANGTNLARGAAVTSLDNIEAPVRWRASNLTDGIYPGASPVAGADVVDLRAERESLVDGVLDAAAKQARTANAAAHAEVDAALAALPPPLQVYAGTVHTGSGNFRGTGAADGKPRAIHLLHRGQVTQPGPAIQPAALAALDHVLPGKFELPPDASDSERRAALGRWLTDPRHPLTWRSIVNRVWQHHFGRGLVDTTNDFGHMGALPTHPALLDWLAVAFRDDCSGSLKRLHRLLVTSATYRQSSAVDNPQAQRIDANNTLLWRGLARKLEAEVVRDAVLQISGTLDLSMGGPGWQDFVIERPEHSPHYRYDLADPEDRSTWRRAIYRFTVRSQLQPFLTALDCADPSLRVDKRNQSVSPTQALALLNNGFLLTQSKHFAARVQREAGTAIAAQVARAFRLATGRHAHADELSPLIAYATQHGLANTCRVLLNLNELAFID